MPSSRGSQIKTTRRSENPIAERPLNSDSDGRGSELETPREELKDSDISMISVRSSTPEAFKSRDKS